MSENRPKMTPNRAYARELSWELSHLVENELAYSLKYYTFEESDHTKPDECILSIHEKVITLVEEIRYVLDSIDREEVKEKELKNADAI